MTPHEDKARSILDPHLTDTADGYLIDYYEVVGAIAAALAEERERCAKIADAYRKDGDWNTDTCEAIATSIRNPDPDPVPHP
jgi:hypothetical protein